MALLRVLVFVLCAQYATAQEDTPSPGQGEVRMLIEEAIALGVPLYNNGRLEACAAVYRIALRSLQLMAPKWMSSQLIDDALNRAAREDSNRGAWTLRYALDDVYRMAGVDLGVTMRQGPFALEFDQGGRWYTINDGVMGGLSRGSMGLENTGIANFYGQLSLANNGGFSSVRTAIAEGSLDRFDGLELRIRGDQRDYALLAAQADVRGTWQQKFSTETQWQIVRIAFTEMTLSMRGWRPPNSPTVRAERIAELGIIISDKDERPFSLEIDWIRGYKSQ